MSNETKYNMNEKWVIYIISAVVGIFIIVCSMLAASAISLATDLPETFASPIASVCAGIGAFFAGLISSKKIKSHGIINGIICGGLLYVLILVISAFLNFDSFSIMTLYRMLIMILSGAIGGVLGVNMSSRRKII